MLRLVYGNPGTGKSRFIYNSITDDSGKGKRSFIIVPEQTALDTEYRIAGISDGKAGLYCEVQSFRRLCNRVSREYGGLCYNYADETVQHLIMNRALKAVIPLLDELGASARNDRSLSGEMLRLSSEFSSSGHSLEEVEKIADKLALTPTGRKLRDISLIISTYRNLLGERFTDPCDDLDRLYENLRQNSFFAGTNVYIDSFQSMTGAEMKIVGEIIRQADNTTITLSLPGPFFTGIDTVSQRTMSDQIRRCSSALGIIPEIKVLDTPHRYSSRNIAYLSSDLWLLDSVTVPAPADGHVEIIRTSDAYDEAEEAAAAIRKLIENGYRCSDICVIARDAGQFRGIIEPELEKAGIPWFFSEKRSVVHSRPSRLLLSALRALQYGWRREDIICFLRTGISSVTYRETDIFESYTETWNITGKGFLTDSDWTMNPDGYKAEFTESGADRLAAANKVRRTVVGLLSVFSDCLNSAQDCAEMCRAAYDFLKSTGIVGSLNERTSSLLAMKKRQEAVENASLLNRIAYALERISVSYPEGEKIEISEFCRALETAFESVKTGTIPQSRDCVIIGSADMIRAENIKCAVLCGVYDGSFPATAEGKGILNDYDRDAVRDAGLTLSSDRKTRGSDELFFARRSISFPSDRLIVLTRNSQPSVIVERIISMTDGLRPAAAGSDLISRINSEENAREYAGLYRGTVLGESAAAAIGGIERILIDASGDVFSAQTAEKLFGKRIVLSQSKTDAYTDCPFRYACKYSLGLSDNEKASFSYSQSGDFIHFVLEKFLIHVFTVCRGRLPDKEERIPVIDGIAEQFISRIAPDGSIKNGARLNNSLRRLKIIAEGIIDDLLNEFSDSSFIPEYFELPIGSGDFPSVSLKLRDGTTVSVTGVADRVDVFRKDGKAYIRITDYKTGDTSFSLESAENGEDLQLLLYLFSLAQTDNALNADGSEVIPASVSYINAKIPSVKGNGGDTDVNEKIAGNIVRTGLILDSEEVASAVSSVRNPHFLPKNKDSVISEENLRHLNEKVNSVLTDIAEGLKSGNAKAMPREKKTCGSCRYLPVCRYSGGFGKNTESEDTSDA